MNTLQELKRKEAELLQQINGIAKWAGLGFCVGEILELKEVRKQIEALRANI